MRQAELGLGLAFRRCGGSGRSGGCVFGRCGRRIVFRHIGRRSVVFAIFFDNGGRFLRLDFGRTQFGLGLAVAGSLHAAVLAAFEMAGG